MHACVRVCAHICLRVPVWTVNYSCLSKAACFIQLLLVVGSLSTDHLTEESTLWWIREGCAVHAAEQSPFRFADHNLVQMDSEGKHILLSPVLTTAGMLQTLTQQEALFAVCYH